MRKSLLALSLICALTGLTTATTHADVVVWNAGTNFDSEAVGPYGTTTDFGDTSTPALNIVTPGEGGIGNAMELTWNQDGSFLNFQSAGSSYPTSGNTNTFLANYTLEFDMQITGVDAGPYPQGFQISIFGPNGGVFSGPKVELDLTTNVFSAGQGYQHYAFTLDQFVAHNNFDPTAASFTVGFGIVSFGGPNTPATPETADIDNLQITMKSNPLPPPHPTNSIVAAKPGLRLFAQNSAHNYNQEGFSTVDLNQSWVGAATPANPVSYSITIGDFNTVNNYALYVQFVQNGNPGDPFGVFNAQNALVWTIQSAGGSGGFTTSVNWKTNLPANGQPNVAMPVTTTTSTNGIGTWTLTFTDDLDGTVTAPDGTTGIVTLPDEAAAADFANSCIIDFGAAPNNDAGFGQWITFNKIAISNVVDGTEYDDFTQDTNLNTSLWNPGFSLDTGSAIQVPPGKSYWVNWTAPAAGFGLETKAQLVGGTNMWFSPAYYGSGVGVSNTAPTLMGTQLFWSLVPSACFPTTDGTTNGPVSPTAFFRLAFPPPTQ
ncbi:MAG TPA: hypothetical protein VKV04_15880 [Verrucomicrobiae bacterium]|nr:hypothetical protein [Verrucomicrobiae bacterium]